MSIEIRNITKSYGDQKALNDVSFKVNNGEIVGFLGPNGAGKSTLMKILTGFLNPDDGDVLINGLDIKDNLLEVRKTIGYLPENNPLYLDMYVKEYLQFVAGIYKLGRKSSTRIKEIIEITGLQVEQNKRIGALSKGYKQRIGLAQALIHKPDVLILDEPTSGLDPNQIIEIRNLIKETGKHKTILLSTHIMQEVEAICERIVIINKGKIVADDKPGNIQDIVEPGCQTIFIEFDKPVNEKALSSIEYISKTVKINETSFIIQSNSEEDIRPVIFKFAVDKGLTVLSLQKKEKTLEEVFQKLTMNKY